MILELKLHQNRICLKMFCLEIGFNQTAEERWTGRDYYWLDYMSGSHYFHFANPPACRETNGSVLMHTGCDSHYLWLLFIYEKKINSFFLLLLLYFLVTFNCLTPNRTELQILWVLREKTDLTQFIFLIRWKVMKPQFKGWIIIKWYWLIPVRKSYFHFEYQRLEVLISR